MYLRKYLSNTINIFIMSMMFMICNTDNSFSSSFKELILERRALYKQINQPQETLKTDLKLIARAVSGDKEAIEQLKREMQGAKSSSDGCEKRLKEVDAGLFEAWIDLHRSHVKEPTFAQRLCVNPPVIKETSEVPKVILVPDVVANKAPQKFYSSYDETRGLWFCMELLEPDNVAWWRERLGWEATMQLKKNCLQEISEIVSTCMTEPEETIDSRIEAFVKQSIATINNGYFVTTMENDYQLMALRSAPIEKASAEYQEGFLKYNPLKEQRADYLGAFRAFKCGLDRHRQVPTWVAYLTSQKAEGPAHTYLEVTSPAIKMAMTATVGGPFYSPQGIYKSAIAQAYDLKPCERLSLRMHSLVARTFGEIEPDIHYGITRPQTLMLKVFKSSGLPHTSFPGIPESSTELPYLFKDGFLDSKFYLTDPRRNVCYVISENHPFAVNYFLGGILLRDIEFPFITFERESLGNIQ